MNKSTNYVSLIILSSKIRLNNVKISLPTIDDPAKLPLQNIACFKDPSPQPFYLLREKNPSQTSKQT